MSFLPRAGLTLLGALCLGAHPPAGTLTNGAPTNDEIGYVALIPCTGACEASSAPRTASILLDRQTSQTIPMTADAWSPDGMKRLIGGVDILVLPVLDNRSVNLTNHPAHYWKTTTTSFRVQSVGAAGLTYKPASNHDPDGDSNGTTVTVTR
jgi:hypothetical protein